MKTTYKLLSLALSLLTFAACTDDAEFTEPEVGHRVLSMSVSAERPTFGTPETRAESNTAWQTGDKLYIQLSNNGKQVAATAVYDAEHDAWSLDYAGKLVATEQGTCTVRFFENAASVSKTEVVLSPFTITYADEAAVYGIQGETLHLSTTLRPDCFRLRFSGKAGRTVYVGSSDKPRWYVIDSDELEGQCDDACLTVSSTPEDDGKCYTPYVYLHHSEYGDALYIASINGCFQRSFTKETLANGESGVYSLPTETYFQGWRSTEFLDDVEWSPSATDEQKNVILGILLKMIVVNGDSFEMGRDSGDEGYDSWNDNSPKHKVHLSDFMLSQYEVTQREWTAVMGSAISKWKEEYGLGDDYPAYYLSYSDCENFIAKLNQLSGLKFTFPTEAQWEAAARGNFDEECLYAGGNTIDTYAWYSGNSDGTTHPVGLKRPDNCWVFYDMSGNVSEWCSDLYGPYPSGAVTDPTGTGDDNNGHVQRGGGFKSSAQNCTVFYRASQILTNLSSENYGLRLAHPY